MARRTTATAALLVAGALVAQSACASTPEAAPEAPEAAREAPAPPSGGSVFQKATARVRAQLDQAQSALQAQQMSRARPLLESAAADLQKLEAELPGEPLLGLLDRTIADVQADPRKADFTRLRTTARDMKPQLDPDTFRAVEDARFALLAGNPEQAVTRLQDARTSLGTDTQRAGVARVRAQIEQAVQALGNRDAQAASRSLGEARTQLREVEARGPLVPVRWNLRTAAAAADDGDWQKAEQSLADAVHTLEQIREPGGSNAGAEVQELEAQARAYLQRLDGPQRPSADQLRDLASRTLEVRAG